MSEAVKQWGTPTLGEIGLPRTPNVDPSNYPKEIFELYSVPSFSLNRPEIVPGSAIGSTKQLVEPGDVLLCKIVPHLVRVWCVPSMSTHRQIASGEWIVVRPDPAKADNHYLRYALIEPRFRSQFMETVSGVGGSLMRARPKAVAQIRVPLPAKVEQLRIVTKLDSLLGRSKNGREELAHIPRLVQRYREAVLAFAFRGVLTGDWRGKASTKPKGSLTIGLDAARSAYFRQARIKEKPASSPSWTPDIDLPGGWEFVSVDQLTTLVQYGSSAKTSESLTEGVPVLRMGNIFEGQLDYTNLKYLPASHDEFPELLLQDGDILFNRTNSAELVGKTAVYSDMGHPTSFASYLIRLRVVGYLPELLSAYINSSFGREWVRSVVNQQVGQANVNGTKLRELGVPMMPMDEQKELWSRINRAFTRIEHLSKEATRATELLDRLDQATLAKAFRGAGQALLTKSAHNGHTNARARATRRARTAKVRSSSGGNHTLSSF
jgi:type I restriction enzyme S subunit